jgi:hypothetical protein
MDGKEEGKRGNSKSLNNSEWRNSNVNANAPYISMPKRSVFYRDGKRRDSLKQS